MLPLAANTRIAEYFAAIFVGIRSTQLTAMGDLEHYIRRVSRGSREDCGSHQDTALIREAWNQLTATGCAAGHWLDTIHAGLAAAGGSLDSIAVRVVNAYHASAFCGDRSTLHADLEVGARAAHIGAPREAKRTADRNN